VPLRYLRNLIAIRFPQNRICSSVNRPFRIAPSDSGASLSTIRRSENPGAGHWTKQKSNGESKVGAANYNRIGLTELIAISIKEYVDIAAALARAPDRLEQLCRALRPRMATSPLCDAAAFARKMEAAFKTMWQRWCDAPKT
jgi:hypothetical protein